MKGYDEADDIDKALKGDFGARLRVEVLLPYHAVLKDAITDAGKKKDILATVNVFNEFIHAQVSQVILTSASLSSPEETDVEKLATVINYLDKLRDMTIESFIRTRVKP